jgi:hypothetical protein
MEGAVIVAVMIAVLGFGALATVFTSVRFDP